jgi:phospholipid/cholesterol/gamma-HCH transport system permease protein
MKHPPNIHTRFLSRTTSHTGSTLRILGDWTLPNYGALGEAIDALHRSVPPSARLPPDTVDLAGITSLDTAGASRLLDLFGPDQMRSIATSQAALPPERQALLDTVAASGARTTYTEAQKRSTVLEILGNIGGKVVDLYRQAVMLLGFMGVTLEALVRTLVRPKRWRITSIVAQIEQTGLNAVPIVAMLTFMVGAVIAFLGATILADFGATVYTVNLVAFSFLREFAVLLTAILMAGRTASAFTAQIGSMKVNEEIDAIRISGLDPVEVLVLPRILALLVTLPLLTFVGMISGIVGGMLVCAMALDISPAMFLAIFQQDVELTHFILGIAKAPVFAYLIAIIGCMEGFKVSGSAQAVGEHTTSAVVQSIFIVILLDAMAALFFMEMGW